jgi:endonuclease/exonuclease/phosphatase (EEP) superfamily protein YafD
MEQLFKAKRGFEELRQTQARKLCEHLRNTSQLSAEAVVVCGDFNDEPQSLAARTMREFGFQSAYSAVGRESYSTSKIREDLVERCIDYIWFDARLSPGRVLEIPDAQSLGPRRLPQEVSRKQSKTNKKR